MKNNFFYKSQFSNIYKKSSKLSEVTSQVLYGERFKILSKNKNWIKIKSSFDNYVGYIKNENYSNKHNPSHKVYNLKATIFSKPNKITKKFLPFGSKVSIIKKNKNNGMVYVFELNKKYDIDGGVARNYARFINHSCDPNCEVEINDNQIWISSIKRIKKGLELTYNYGYPFDSDFEEHICKCGTKKCVGYILSDDDWSKLKKTLNKKK